MTPSRALFAAFAVTVLLGGCWLSHLRNRDAKKSQIELPDGRMESRIVVSGFVQVTP